MSAQHPLLRLAFVSKRFLLAGSRSDFVAVDRVCLDIAAGQRFGIVGGSSAGRSRLLRLINLLKRPDAGGVVIDGRGLTRLSRRDLREARAGIGMIQQFNLLQNATVYDTVAFPLTIRRPPRPAVMLWDESTSALDSGTTRSVLDILADINERLGATLVIVTPELAVAPELCERVAVMADGRIVEDIAMEPHGDRLQTVIARADRGGDDRPIGGTSFVAADAAPVERAARRRVGGLPLPGKTAPLDAGRAAGSVAQAQVAVSRWVCRFPAPRVATVDASDRGETVAPVRRVGGLPMPGKHAPMDRVDTSAPSSLSPGVPDPLHLDLTSPGRPIRIGVSAGPHAQIAAIA